MGLRRSMTDSVTGKRMQLDPVLQLLVLNNVKWELDAELFYQNNSIRDHNMREVRDLAAGMKQAIAGLKQSAVDAKNNLNAEIAHAQVNAEKVNALTADLKAANLGVDSFLGETGSNFPPSGTVLSTPPSAVGKADANGVTLNPDAKQ
jgi:hypothetical protein